MFGRCGTVCPPLAAEHIGQQFRNLFSFIERGVFQNVLQLAFVEPQAVASWTFVYEQRRCGLVRHFRGGLTDDDFLHFFQADRAFFLPFGAVWVDFERGEQLFGLLLIAEQKLHLAGIEPDAAAVGAMVGFDLGKLDGNHCIFTNRAIHKNFLPKFIRRRCSGFIC